MLLLVGIFLATQPGAACTSDTSSDGSSQTPIDSSVQNDIPHRAAIVADGKGPISFTADADGEAYIQDVKTELTLFTRRVHSGDVIRVVPEENRVLIDNDSVYDGDLKKDHRHRIYLLRDRRFDETSNGKPSNTVPRDAIVIGEGADKEITFRANHDGRAYLIESDTRKMIATVDLKDGERFTFSPGANRVTVDGKRVVGRDFNTRMKYRVYFDRN